MRTIATIFLFALLCTTAAWSQRGKHPHDPKAQFLGSFGMTLKDHIKGTKGLATLADGAGYSVIISVFRSEGRIDYLIAADGITFTGDDEWVDSKTTPQLFELFAKSAISQGILLGYTPCSSTCDDGQKTTRVYAPSCVKRDGQGIATKFTDCLPGIYSIREYTVCCPNGIEAPVTQLVFAQGGTCVGSCESTIP